MKSGNVQGRSPSRSWIARTAGGDVGYAAVYFCLRNKRAVLVAIARVNGVSERSWAEINGIKMRILVLKFSGIDVVPYDTITAASRPAPERISAERSKEIVFHVDVIGARRKQDVVCRCGAS